MASETEEQRDEIHRKIGRNIALLQKIELSLKWILSKSNFSILYNYLESHTPSLQDQAKQQKEIFAQKTLGCVSRMLCDRVVTEPKDFPDDVALSKGEVRFRFGFNQSFGSSDRQKEFEEELNSIVEERNRLVHGLFTTFDLSSPEGILALDTFLDHQHCKALAMSEELLGMVKMIQEGRKLIGTYLLSEDYSAPELYIVALSICIQRYVQLPENQKKTGWSNLATARKCISQECPGALAACQKKYGTNSLRKILLGTDIFDLLDDGPNVFWRMKPEYWIEPDGDGEWSLCKRIFL